MQRLRTVTSLDVSAVAGHHAMPAALLFKVVGKALSGEVSCTLTFGGWGWGEGEGLNAHLQFYQFDKADATPTLLF